MENNYNETSLNSQTGTTADSGTGTSPSGGAGRGIPRRAIPRRRGTDFPEPSFVSGFPDKKRGPFLTFLFAYLKTMRLYYSFITGIAGWIGVSFYFFVKLRDTNAALEAMFRFRALEVIPGLEMPYHFIVLGREDYLRGAIILLILFLAWGINQVFNDWLGLEEDRINAPNRPMVTGELNVRLALATSCILMFLACCISWWLNPWSLIPMLAGFFLNFLYEYSKAWGLWGNVVFGVMIAQCCIYGFLAAGPVPDPLITSNRLSVLFLVALMNGLMTFYTYFKDYEGDKAAGKNTFIVRYGLGTARVAGIIGAFLPTIAFFICKYAGWLPVPYTEYFVFCGTMTVFLQLWTAVLYYRHPYGERTYFSLAVNFRACVAGQVTMISLFNGILALYLLNASYILIGFLFDLYSDARA